MERRQFLRNGLLATAASTLTYSEAKSTPSPKESSRTVSAATNNFKLKYAPHFGMFENSAGKDFVDQLNFMADNGFMALEDNGLMGRSVEDQNRIGATLAKRGMTMGVFVVSFDNWPPKSTLATGKAEWRDKFLSTCREAVNVAKRVNAKWMTVVPGNFERNLPIGIQTGHVIESLRQAAAIFEPHGLTMVLEPLSDNPDLFLRFSDQTYAICKGVNHRAKSCLICTTCSATRAISSKI
jgi:hydroxypyruvate isomerase